MVYFIRESDGKVFDNVQLSTSIAIYEDRAVRFDDIKLLSEYASGLNLKRIPDENITCDFLISENRISEATRLYREITGCGFKEAYDYIKNRIETEFVSVERFKNQIKEIEGVDVDIKIPPDKLLKSYNFERLPDDATVDDLTSRICECLDNPNIPHNIYGLLANFKYE